ncbi:OmpA family protein [Adhaeribacter soli]|uniref:OmpA family protein n=1 Tax=Adhaeribacter soli TaxID=2607655 RepID=A0A5N1J1G9_9BACT|nr:OmpA family protein [Adhaeribacter soli]KAA9340633.1 OmpA family protein [Adhaeribacter soli]
MMSFRVLFIAFFLTFWLNQPGLAQDQKKALKSADKAFFNNDYKTALPLYEKALKAQPNNLRINGRLGLIYLELQQPDKAIPFLQKATSQPFKSKTDYALSLARAYHLNNNFEEAIAQYQVVLNKTSRKDEEQRMELQKRITECRSGKELTAAAAVAEVKNVGAPVNSPAADLAPLLTNNGNTLIFTSRHTGTPGKKGVTEDIYFSDLKEEKWISPVAFGKPVNTPDHDAATSISPDGNTLYLYREENGGDIYAIKRTGNNSWGKPVPLPEPINSRDFEPSLFITPDGQFAFFSSDRPDGFGGLDLYLTMKQPDGSWSEAMNLGANVNTEYDEDAPFIAADGVTLYFSSRGHNSMGGYDIFRSSSEGAAWSIAENLGWPVNTPYDDIYFVPTPNGHQGYFCSDRIGGLGDKDIYLATFRTATATDSLIAEAEVQPVIPEPVIASGPVSESGAKPVLKVKLSGRVQDAASGVPLTAQLVLIEKGKAGSPLKLTADTLGAFELELKKNVAYSLLVQKEGYFYENSDLKISDAYKPDTLSKAIALKKIQAGAAIVLRNIFFEYGKDLLTKSSRTELDRLFGLMQENPGMRVEISGHTDNKGKAVYNEALSLKRARAVVNYLVKKGVAKTRMVAVGYGARKPIASNRFEDGRKQNRRTEFKVLQQ